ncbi:asparagine synthase-related protein [Crossiella sp. SN42]|uniref:asparagine synthase-related protein n=1 Tax=Crossiella sp. SN42 TaxID=2944808 RepID=UPI00207C5286|nr:asparagine synthase-related protein [Crossiella sp. SN42]MCO1580718.1 asparagine synthase-related protein [Crossiella sp. SN42]
MALELDDLDAWLVALPDCDSATPIDHALLGQAKQRRCHPSGRPWLLGRWAEDAVLAYAGDTALAVFGDHAVDPGELQRIADRTRTLADLDRLAGSMVGSFHLIASVNGRVRVRGTISSLRPVYRAVVGGVAIASDRADVLAGLLEAGVDENRLALHLLGPFGLYPLAGQPVWTGVSIVDTGCDLLLDEHGRARTRRWWTPPEPVLPMRAGAAELRAALSAAVTGRLRNDTLVSADLGGVDSTALCCLAAHGPGTVVAYTTTDRDPLGDDADWARRTVSALDTDIEHHVIPAGELPLGYDSLHELTDPFDEPCRTAVDRNRWLTIARAAARRGSRRHFAGFGGDEVLAGSPAHLHGLSRTDPLLALSRLRGYVALNRWSYRDTARQLLDRRPYRAWLAEAADRLTGPPPPADSPGLSWGRQPRLPSWATRDAVGAVRDLIREAARTAEPLAAGHGQHAELEGIRAVSRVIRQLGQMAARIGVTLAAPYYDDRVLTAGLAVRPADRITPWRYKPLIAEAMRGIVPAASLTRTTKADGSHDAYQGLREHRAAVLELFEDSRLGRLGLIDAGALREALHRPVSVAEEIAALNPALSCELWLRALEPRPGHD